LRKFDTILTFGGAYSNHIAATAAAGNLLGIKTIGVIRGEELQQKWHENATLCKATENGMRLHFVSREMYREKQEAQFIETLHQQFGPFWLVPEGGSNYQGMVGCMDILGETKLSFDAICAPVGTGTTVAGIVAAAKSTTQVLGFQALAGNGFEKDIHQLLYQLYWDMEEVQAASSNLKLIADYVFGGYGKTTPQLLDFMAFFYAQFNIELDQVYTAKMMYGIWQLIQADFFTKGSNILAIHTGGLQGNTRWSPI